MMTDTWAYLSTTTSPLDACSHQQLQESRRPEECETCWWQNGFLNNSTINFVFLWKPTFLSENSLVFFIDVDPLRWIGKLSKPGCGLRSILQHSTNLLPKDALASVLKWKPGGGVPERPRASSFLAKEKSSLMVQKTLSEPKSWWNVDELIQPAKVSCKKKTDASRTEQTTSK